MSDETRQLAAFARDLTYEQIPSHVRAIAVSLLVDQIGVEIGCSTLPWAKQVRDTYCRIGNSREATVVRYGDRLPAVAAAFINSTFGHSFEYDDANPLSPGHYGAEFIPPLMAIAERDHISGREFLAAFVAAYEVRGRIGWSVVPDMAEHGGPHYSTTCGPFGAAAGVGRLLGLDAEGIRNALGIAGCFSGGLMQYDEGGGSVKRIICAIAGINGMQAAHLAQAGMTGPERILEGTHGLLKIYASTFRPERLVADFGKKWIIEQALFKPYSCGGTIAAAIDGLNMLISANNLKADDMESIEVGYPKRTAHHVAVAQPYDLLGMQFSTSYSIALTVLKGGNTPREYTAEALADPTIRDFASRVHIREDAELTKQSEGRLPARIKVRTHSGHVFEQLVINARGYPAAPLSSAEIDHKFRSQVADVLGPRRCQTALRVLRNIDALDDLARLPPMLVVKKRRTRIMVN